MESLSAVEPIKKTKIQALVDIWNRQESQVSPYKRAAYYSALAISLGFAIPSGYPYWSIGEKFLAAAFNCDMENIGVKGAAYILGGSSAAINSLFNVWVMDRYMQMFCMPVSAERKIIHESAKNWKTRTKLGLLHFEALFANLAMVYVSLQEEDFKVDFWDVDMIVIGFFIAYANLDTFVDSVVSAIFSCGSKQEKNVARAIQRYFSALHKMQRSNKFQSTDLKGLIKIFNNYIDEESTLTLRDVFPYILGLGIAGATFMGRLGIIEKSYSGADLIVNKTHIDAINTSFADIARYFIAGLAILPPISFGIKTSIVFGTYVYQSFYNHIWGQSSPDESIAMQTHPNITEILQCLLLIGVLGSFAGNAYLNVEAAEDVSIGVWWYYLIAAIAAPIMSNGFGVFALAKDVIGRLTGMSYFSREDECYYANEEQFFVDYELLLSKALNGDNKSAIELLVYFPDLIDHLIDFDITKEDLKSIVASVEFTETEKETMMRFVNQDEEKFNSIEEFKQYFCKLFDLKYKDEEKKSTILGSGEEKPLLKQSEMLDRCKMGFFACCGYEEEGYTSVPTSASSSNFASPETSVALPMLSHSINSGTRQRSNSWPK